MTPGDWFAAAAVVGLGLWLLRYAAPPLLSGYWAVLRELAGKGQD